jgi:hypothetical protein
MQRKRKPVSLNTHCCRRHSKALADRQAIQEETQAKVSAGTSQLTPVLSKSRRQRYEQAADAQRRQRSAPGETGSELKRWSRRLELRPAASVIQQHVKILQQCRVSTGAMSGSAHRRASIGFGFRCRLTPDRAGRGLNARTVTVQTACSRAQGVGAVVRLMSEVLTILAQPAMERRLQFMGPAIRSGPADVSGCDSGVCCRTPPSSCGLMSYRPVPPAIGRAGELQLGRYSRARLAGHALAPPSVAPESTLMQSVPIRAYSLVTAAPALHSTTTRLPLQAHAS